MDHCKVDFVEGMKLIPPILAALIASRSIWAGTRGWYRRTWGSHQVWRKKLNLLANGATVEYVEDLLGTPVFKNDEPPSIWEEDDEKPKWVDHIFSTPHAWVVTRRIEGVLVAWSVTITDPKFWWGLEDATFGMVKGKLGRVTFNELLDRQTGKYESSGARSGLYAEAAYFGSPGAYQMYIFMHNEEGIGKFTPSGSSDVRMGDFKWPDDREDHPATNDAATRAETTVNTIIVTRLKDELTHHPWQQWPVAASDQTKLLHRFNKKHGWQNRTFPGRRQCKVRIALPDDGGAASIERRASEPLCSFDLETGFAINASIAAELR